MPLTATSPRRRLIMAILLALAVAGGFIRAFADNPSPLRDFGTLLMVLWLPAVGNLIGYLKEKLPRGAPPPLDFEPGLAFVPQLWLRLEPVDLPAGFVESLDAADPKATVIVGRRGFTVRMARPVVAWLAEGEAGLVELQLLRPESVGKVLAVGNSVYLAVGAVAVARGNVEAVTG